MRRDDRVYLRHILEAIEKIDFYLGEASEEAFLKNSLVQDGIIRQIEIIGEATRHLSQALRSAHHHIPWTDIAGMRDKLIHDYFGVDLDQVWLTAKEDIPIMKTEVQKVLDALETQGDGV